jgi:chromosomal replication initiation ATPase DnaA
MKPQRPPEPPCQGIPGNLDLVSLHGMHTHKLIVSAVASVFAAPVQELVVASRPRRRSRTGPSPRRNAFAKQVAMYLAHVACGLSMEEVGHLFGRHRTTVAHGCHVVEDGRDDPILDRSLAVLESVLGSPTWRDGLGAASQ